MMAEIRQADPALRAELAGLHALPNRVIEAAVAEVLRGQRRDVRLVTALIGGLVEVAARQAMGAAGRAPVKRELRRAVTGLLGD
jgi:hypothetical protein